MGSVVRGCQTYPLPLTFPVKTAQWCWPKHFLTNVLAALKHIPTVPHLFRHWTRLEVYKRGFDPRNSLGFNINLAEPFCLFVFIVTFWQYRLQKLRTPIADIVQNTQSPFLFFLHPSEFLPAFLYLPFSIQPPRTPCPLPSSSPALQIPSCSLIFQYSTLMPTLTMS